jgi:amino acid transporter
MNHNNFFRGTVEIVSPKDVPSADDALVSEAYVPKTMPPVLGTWSMTATFIVCIYLASGATTAAAGGAAAFTYLLIGCLTFFIPSIVATMQLGILFPNEGALYNWTHKTFGGYWSFFSGFCAWFPGVLITASFGDLFVTYIQAMQPAWLTTPWQQGLAICGYLIFCGFVSIQRFRIVRNIINMLVVLLLGANVLIGLAGALWWLRGHPSATNFSHLANWNITPGNFVLFGLIVFAYIGVEGPLNMAGEIKGPHVIKRHLIWGGAIIFLIYIASTFSVLVVEGQAAAYNPYALVMVVDKVLGKNFGSITAICLMGSFIAEGMVYNYVFARLMMVAGIDGRLKFSLGRLNKHRVPANAIITQTILGVVITLIGFNLVPMASVFGSPANLAIQVYNVMQAAATLVWAVSTLFLFVDIVGCYQRYRESLLARLVVPLRLLWLCVIVGVGSCLVGIVDILLNSWIPQLSNNQWLIIVGVLTISFLIVAAAGSVFAGTEATWEKIADTTPEVTG